jgi:uncharacterized OsmC-like protein/alpha/beta superfamily hydrolase
VKPVKAVTERVEFEGSHGTALVGHLEHARGPMQACALFAHCFTCSKDIKAAVQISRSLAEQGVTTLRFDFTGLGESPGDFADTAFSSNIDDLVAAARFLRERGEGPSLLVGHSLGGAAVLAAAAKIDEAKAVATVGAPFEPQHVRHLLAPASEELAKKGVAEVLIAGRKFRIKQQMLDDLDKQCSREAIASLGKALLVFHSPQDNIVGIDNARRIYQAARHPKSFVSLDGADHLLRKQADARYVGSVLAAWAQRYLDLQPHTPLEPGVVVVEAGAVGFAQRVRSGRHQLAADEPLDVGGTDTGLGPYDLLLAGLGACTSMTLRMYADRKKWPLEAVRVSLKHAKIHAKDCTECETKTGKLDDIERTLELEGALDDTQRARLLEIADMCPVHRTLHNEVRIRTRLE